MAIGVINHGRRYDKPRPSLYETTGNEISNHGQRNFKPRATKFQTTGNEIYANPFVFRKRRAYRFSFFVSVYIYIRLQKKKNQYLIAGRPPKSRFFLQ